MRLAKVLRCIACCIELDAIGITAGIHAQMICDQLARRCGVQTSTMHRETATTVRWRNYADINDIEGVSPIQLTQSLTQIFSNNPKWMSPMSPMSHVICLSGVSIRPDAETQIAL